jgi:hypothetical protein
LEGAGAIGAGPFFFASLATAPFRDTMGSTGGSLMFPDAKQHCEPYANLALILCCATPFRSCAKKGAARRKSTKFALTCGAIQKWMGSASITLSGY